MKKAQEAWESEYNSKKLMTGDTPAKSLLAWLKYITKSGVRIADARILDLGSGEGKNALHLAHMGAHVEGIEIARNAIRTTEEKIVRAGLEKHIRIHHGSIGEAYPFCDDAFDLLIDVTSSNSLTEDGRAVYLQESARVLKPGGYGFVRALCKDGDHNAKQLLKDYPGDEQDTYIIPEWGQTERVFAREDIVNLYNQYFDILDIAKETHYSTFANRKYKRNFWILYLQNKAT
jgi:SAM-dependent methyltransferase